MLKSLPQKTFNHKDTRTPSSNYKLRVLVPSWFRTLLDPQQLDFELQIGVWWDCGWSASGAVGQITRDEKIAFAAHFHGRETFVPAFDYLTKFKFGRPIELARVIE